MTCNMGCTWIGPGDCVDVEDVLHGVTRRWIMNQPWMIR